ncbi:MAG TPA: MEDS domain-containing protein, partial [Candidatus Elarobacter sp.]|nr:MEDS domain-containing protein [Candidatus Elarobacter sp.]
MSAVRSDERAHGREHTVGFYDSDDALVASVVAFVAPGLGASGAAIVVVTAEHRLAIESRLRELGFPLDDLIAGGRYVSVDARSTLEQLLRNGVLDADRF